MEFLGSWILGNRGAKKLERLTLSLRKVLLEDFNKELNLSLSTYKPWMSHDLLSQKLAPICKVDKEELLIRDSKTLSLLEEVYTINDLKKGKSKIARYLSPDNSKIEVYHGALDLVLESSDCMRERFKSLVLHIVPMEPSIEDLRPGGVGNSSELAKGAIFLSCPTLRDFQEIELAINICHEMGHQALMVYQSSDKILKDPFESKYSGVRKENRESIRSFHALVALCYMIEFLVSIENDSNFSLKEINYIKGRRRELLEAFFLSFKDFSREDFTEIGCALYQDVESFASYLDALFSRKVS